MWQNAHNAYLESRIESADPLQLVRLLYQGAITSVKEAGMYLAAGNITARSRSISKAHAILGELAAALDHNRGGELSQRLALLYDYMQRRLLEANFRQIAAPLEEVLALLETLGEAWDGIQPQTAPEPAANPWQQASLEESPPVPVPAGWNL